MEAPRAGVPQGTSAADAARAQRAVAHMRRALLPDEADSAGDDVVSARTSGRRILGGVPVTERLERTRVQTWAARQCVVRDATFLPHPEACPRPAEERPARRGPGFMVGMVVGFLVGRRARR